MNTHPQILVLDFGSQYTQLIARKIRELKVNSLILPWNTSIEKIRELAPRGVIFSGGPSSVYDVDAPQPEYRLEDLGVPILGVCYGLQLCGRMLGATVLPGESREYGLAQLKVVADPLFEGFAPESRVWMSHGDQLAGVPEGCSVLARTDT
ncbi:MAG: GMP synthase (glutamine-hydrolyzing), partial [Candidatus Cloacimonetes bacterium]|nr:GMP synthase (glutamine-hydrolyzing) [Candidatus Cloacimonadota bacterium]